MFKTPWYDSSVIKSDEGFSVKWGRDSAVYQQAGRKLTFTVDIGAGQADIFVDSISRWDDTPIVQISSETRFEIAKNVQQAFEWKGFVTRLIAG